MNVCVSEMEISSVLLCVMLVVSVSAAAEVRPGSITVFIHDEINLKLISVWKR